MNTKVIWPKKKETGRRKTEKESKREIKVKKSHHISTEPLLNVIHDRGLRYRDLWSKAMDKQSAGQNHPKETDVAAQQQTNKHNTKRKIHRRLREIDDNQMKPSNQTHVTNILTHTHTHTHTHASSRGL